MTPQLPPLAFRLAVSASASATSGRSATSTWTSPPARCSACSATTAPARRPRSGSSRRSPRPPRAARRSPATTWSADAARGPLADRPGRAVRVRRRPADGAQEPATWPAGSTTCPRTSSRKRADELLERIGLADVADNLVRTFSGGMRRRLDLAASLIASPPVLFLDEPTTGLDPASRNDLWALLRELVADGATLVLTTQYLEEADRLADQIVVLDHGRVAAQGSPSELKARIGGERIEVTRRRRPSRSTRTAAALAPYSTSTPARRPGRPRARHRPDRPRHEADRGRARARRRRHRRHRHPPSRGHPRRRVPDSDRRPRTRRRADPRGGDGP